MELSDRDRQRMINILAKKANYTLLRDEEKIKAEGLYTQAQKDLRELTEYKDRIVASSAEKDRSIQENVRTRQEPGRSNEEPRVRVNEDQQRERCDQPTDPRGGLARIHLCT